MLAANVAAFKAAILSDVSLTSARAAGDHGAIAAYYNGTGVGTVWRPAVANSELNTAIVWSEFLGLTVQAQNTYMAIIASGTVDATSANVRGGFASVFGPATVSRTNLTTLAQRAATRFEALFTTAQVCTEFGTTVSVADVALALGS